MERKPPQPWRWKTLIRTVVLKMMMRSPTMDARDCAKPLSLMCCLSPASAARLQKVHRERMIWGSFLGGLTRPEFSRMFRMDHATFEFVVERLSPRLQRDFLQPERGGGYISLL